MDSYNWTAHYTNPGYERDASDDAGPRRRHLAADAGHISPSLSQLFSCVSIIAVSHILLNKSVIFTSTGGAFFVLYVQESEKSEQDPRNHGVQEVNLPPLFQVRGPHMALDPSLFVVFTVTCARYVAV